MYTPANDLAKKLKRALQDDGKTFANKAVEEQAQALLRRFDKTPDDFIIQLLVINAPRQVAEDHLKLVEERFEQEASKRAKSAFMTSGSSSTTSGNPFVTPTSTRVQSRLSGTGIVADSPFESLEEILNVSVPQSAIKSELPGTGGRDSFSRYELSAFDSPDTSAARKRNYDQYQTTTVSPHAPGDEDYTLDRLFESTSPTGGRVRLEVPRSALRHSPTTAPYAQREHKGRVVASYRPSLEVALAAGTNRTLLLPQDEMTDGASSPAVTTSGSTNEQTATSTAPQVPLNVYQFLLDEKFDKKRRATRREAEAAGVAGPDAYTEFEEFQKTKFRYMMSDFRKQAQVYFRHADRVSRAILASAQFQSAHARGFKSEFDMPVKQEQTTPAIKREPGALLDVNEIEIDEETLHLVESAMQPIDPKSYQFAKFGGGFERSRLIRGRIVDEDPDAGKLAKNRVRIEAFPEDVHDVSEKPRSSFALRLTHANLGAASLFLGQTVVIRGYSSESTIVVTNLFAHAYIPRRPPVYSLRPGPLPRLGIESPRPTKFMIATGPFNTPDSLLTSALSDLIDACQERRPDVLILLGPFIPAGNPNIGGTEPKSRDALLAMTSTQGNANTSGRGDDKSHITPAPPVTSLRLIDADGQPLTFAQFFESMMRDLVERLREAGCGQTRVMIIPSTADVHHVPVFPQPPFEVQNTEGLEQVTFLPNPCVVAVAGTTIAACSADVLQQLSESECYIEGQATARPTPVRPKLEEKELETGSTSGSSPPSLMAGAPPVDAYTARMRRLCAHILGQRSFYPTFPYFAGGVDATINPLANDGLNLPFAPDLFVLPSRMIPFATTVTPEAAAKDHTADAQNDPTLFVNPGTLVKGQGGGTYAVVTVRHDKKPFASRAEVDIINI